MRERIAKMRERGERKKEYRRKEMMLKSEFRAFSRLQFSCFLSSIMRLQNLALYSEKLVMLLRHNLRLMFEQCFFFYLAPANQYYSQQHN
jgi:hypothetical protein